MGLQFLKATLKNGGRFYKVVDKSVADLQIREEAYAIVYFFLLFNLNSIVIH